MHANLGPVYIVDSRRGHYLESSDMETEILNQPVTICRVTSADELSGAIDDAAGLICWHHIPIEARILERLTRCRAIVRAGVGVDNVDLAAATRFGIAVANVPDYGTEEVADHTLALLLGAVRQLLPCDKHVREGGWDWRAIGQPLRLRGRVLGILGFGRIGAAVSRRAQAFGMRVVFYDPYVASGTDKVHGVERLDSVDEVCAVSDFLSIHTPFTPATKGLIGAAQLARMKPTATLINTARGAIVDTPALTRSLSSGRLAFAALDVVENEPEIPRELLDSPRVLLTPHAAFYATEGLRELRLKAAKHLLSLMQGHRVRDVVNTVAS